MADETKEVNVDIDKVELEPSPDEEGDEVITKPEDIEEKETPSGSSPETKPDETQEGEGDEVKEKKPEELITDIRKRGEGVQSPEPEEDKGFIEPVEEEGGEIKRLPNETPREFALRLEVTRLKRLNREKRSQELLGEAKPEKPSGISQTQYETLSDEEKSLLEQYDPSELNTFEKVLDVLAKKHGWVKKEDLQTTTRSQVANDVLDDFLQNHQEYLPENDKDNVLWGRFKSEFQLYKIPENPRDLRKIFNKIHRDIFGVKSEEGLKKIDAQKEKLKVVSHSGGSAQRGQSSPEDSRLTPEQRSHFKGFTEQELDELGL